MSGLGILEQEVHFQHIMYVSTNLSQPRGYLRLTWGNICRGRSWIQWAGLTWNTERGKGKTCMAPSLYVPGISPINEQVRGRSDGWTTY